MVLQDVAALFEDAVANASTGMWLTTADVSDGVFDAMYSGLLAVLTGLQMLVPLLSGNRSAEAMESTASTEANSEAFMRLQWSASCVGSIRLHLLRCTAALLQMKTLHPLLGNLLLKVLEALDAALTWQGSNQASNDVNCLQKEPMLDKLKARLGDTFDAAHEPLFLLDSFQAGSLDG